MASRKPIDLETARAMGARIRAIRGQLTQAEFCKHLGLSRTALANMEAGRRMPNDAILKVLSESSGQTSVEILFGPEFTSREVLDKMLASVALEPGLAWAALTPDEIALVTAVRLAARAGGDLAPVAAILEAAENQFAAGPAAVSGAAAVRRLRAALQRGGLQVASDPIQATADPQMGTAGFLSEARREMSARSHTSTTATSFVPDPGKRDQSS